MNQKAFLAVSIGAIVAGFSGLFIKYMTIPATSIAFIRTAVPVMILGAYMASSGIKFFPGNMRNMMLGSLLNGLRMYLFFLAFINTSISSAVIMLYTWPIFTTIIGIVWLKEKISRPQLALLAVSFLGIVITYGSNGLDFSDKNGMGMLAAVGSAFIYSISVIIFKSESDRFKPFEFVFYQNLAGVLIFLPFFITNETFPTSQDWGLTISYSILMGIGVFSMFFYGLKNLQASTTSMIMYLEIVSGLLTGVIILGEPFGLQKIIGGSLIVLSTLGLRLLKTK